MISYFLIRGFDTPRNICSPFFLGYIPLRPSVEMYLITVASILLTFEDATPNRFITSH